MYILRSQVETIRNIPIMRCILPMEYQWIDCYSIGTNGRVECNPTQAEVIGNILSPHNELHFTNGIPMVDCYSTGTNRTIGANGRVECTPSYTGKVPMMRCISPMEYQWIDYYSISTNRTNGTNRPFSLVHFVFPIQIM